jgi:choline dehydrogenase-like flavoprotein
MAGRAAEWLREAGARTIWENVTAKGSVGAQHQAGTCRMGNDAKTSVTTPYGKLHSVDNVFVVDGSLHVTNGGFNPSLTILALAYRCSEYIVREWKGTRFR